MGFESRVGFCSKINMAEEKKKKNCAMGCQFQIRLPERNSTITANELYSK